MDNPEPWSEKQHAALGRILASWGDLSRGDISIICANITRPGSILTVGGSPHAKFWGNLVDLGWAEMLYSPVDPVEIDYDMQSYRLYPGAERTLSHLLVHYDLLNMGACTPAVDIDRFLAANSERSNDKTKRRVDKLSTKAWTFAITLAVVFILAAAAKFSA